MLALQEVLARFASWLFSLRDGNDIETAFESTWSVAPWLPWSIFAAILMVVLLCYRRVPGGIARRTRILLVVCRSLLVLLVLWMMYGFAMRPYRTDLPDVVLLVDDSTSMSIVDNWSDADRRQQVEALMKSIDAENASRINQAKAMLLGGDPSVLRGLQDRYRVKLAWLSSATSMNSEKFEPTDNAETLGRFVGESLREHRADYSKSNLGDRVRQLIDAQRGRPTAALLAFTDGVTTEGRSWEDAAHYARAKGVPLYLVGTGNDQPAPDVELKDLLAQETVYVNDIVDVGFTVSAVGCEGQRLAVNLRTASDGEVVATTQLSINADRASVRSNLRYRPTHEGRVELLVEVDSLDAEANTENNVRRVMIDVLDEKIKVLLVDSYPRFEFRFLKSLLGRQQAESEAGTANPIELHTVLQQADLDYASTDDTALRVFPVDRETLFAYDVIIFGDCDPAYFSQGVLENLSAFVIERGGGMIVVAGPRFNPIAYSGTPLESLFPIRIASVTPPSSDAVFTESFQVRPTRVGLATPFMQLGDSLVDNPRRWGSLTPVFWFAATQELKPGSLALAEHSMETNDQGANYPLICTQFVGAGKVLMHLTDETYRWRRRDGESLYDNYWRQAIRYLSRNNLTGNGQVELVTDRKQYRRGDPVHLLVRFLDDRMAPAQADGVVVILERAGARKRRVTLERTSAERGVFEGAAFEIAEGQYHAWIVSPSIESPPTADFEVVVPVSEMARLETATSELRQAAKLSGGKAYHLGTVDKLIDDLPVGRHVRIESLVPVPIWNRWPFAIMFVSLIVGEWLIRRRCGLV
ncbi:MAG: VWA domain-containing protein [Planctomycetales bacterium]|nr:VWA domain-containing protein [Planctomycetales bacterium]